MRLTVFGYIGIVLFIVGIVLVVFAIREHRTNQTFITRAVEIDGTVTELVAEDNWSDCRKIRIEFVYQGENHFYVEGPHCPPNYQVKETLSLFFIPNENSVFINDFSHRWSTVVILGCPAGFLVLLGVTFFFFAGFQINS